MEVLDKTVPEELKPLPYAEGLAASLNYEKSSQDHKYQNNARGDVSAQGAAVAKIKSKPAKYDSKSIRKDSSKPTKFDKVAGIQCHTGIQCEFEQPWGQRSSLSEGNSREKALPDYKSWIMKKLWL